MQPLLGICNHYAIWDDHDYGPGDANRAFYNKALGLETFQLFWANPTYGISPQNGITSYFSWSDTEFYLMDNRWFRTDKNIVTSEKVILGDTQIRWLIENLKNSRATFKFVVMGGQFLCAANEKENYINYPEERERILNALEKEEIKGVIFITGDRHFTELSRYTGTSGQVIYDLTVSPLTNSVHKEGATEFNALRVENTLVMERNFGLLEVSGPEGNRQLKITIYNVAGKEIWNKIIPAGELYTRESEKQ
jgi:alkaline phosphatase D